MKIIISLYLLIVIISCTNLREATNINMKEIKSISRDRAYIKKLENEVKEIDVLQSKKCTFIKKVIAKDNVIDQGKDMAILYLKDEAIHLNGNAVLIEKVEKRGDYYFQVHGSIFNCKFVD